MNTMKGMMDMEDKERREHEHDELIAIMERIAVILNKIENDLVWMCARL